MRIEGFPRTAAGSARSSERTKTDGTGLFFADALKSAAEKPPPPKRSPLAGLRENPRGETVGGTEKEDKYCSLCGSMIAEDGSCPLCGVPLFLSGKPGGSVPRTEQAAPSGANAAGFARTPKSFSRAEPRKAEL